MNCADFEILLCEYVDGSLYGEAKTALETHLAECAVCAELARDARAAVDFMQRAAVPEPPAELMTRLMFHLPEARSHQSRWSDSAWARFRARFLEPALQPRFAMGMAMTVLSFAMLGRFAGIQVRQLTPADLNPVKVWSSVEDRVVRGWERAVKYYDSLRVVYEVQTRLREWNDQAEADRAARESGAKTEKKQ